MSAEAIDWAQYSELTSADNTLIHQVTSFTQQYFQNPKFDGSHDYNHVHRVLRTSLYLYGEEKQRREGLGIPRLDLVVIILGALLHDVDDRKYLDAGQGAQEPAAMQELIRLGITEKQAQMIQELVEGVSYSSEIKDVERVRQLIDRIPELAVVQDADRLDAIGAIGIGRLFTYGGAKAARSLDATLNHAEVKLLKLEDMMKTEAGKRLATARTARIREFMGWWQTELNLTT